MNIKLLVLEKIGKKLGIRFFESICYYYGNVIA